MFRKGKRMLASLLSAMLLLSSMTAYAADKRSSDAASDKPDVMLTVSSEHGAVLIEGDCVTQGQEEKTYLVTAGSTVEAQVTPDNVYVVVLVRLGEDELSVDSEGKFRFQMPEQDTILNVTYMEDITQLSEQKKETVEPTEIRDTSKEEQQEVNETAEKNEAKVQPEKQKNEVSKENLEQSESSGKNKGVEKTSGEVGNGLSEAEIDAEIARLHSIAMAGLPRSVYARSAKATEHLTRGTQLDYYGSRTRRYSVNEQEAYCIEPRVSGPTTGDYQVIDSYTVDTEGNGKLDLKYLKAAMWFSYGAPGFDKSMFPDTYFDGTSMDADDYRICSHLLVSKAFQNGSSAIKVGCTAEFYRWYWEEITGDYRNDPAINRNNAWNQIVFDERVNEVPDTFEVYFLYTGPGTQLIAFWDYQPTGYAQLIKTSSNTDITSGNSNYSLKGAEYGVYTDRSCKDKVETLTTGANGKTNKVELDAGRYYVKETSAPKGYALDTSVHSITVTAGDTATVRVSDVPQSDPVTVLLGKTDAETTANMPQGSASLAGAEFTFKYYAAQYSSDPATQGISATRTWVMKTDERGFTRLGDAYKVSGDEFYRLNGVITLPLGTITIQETKAPEGYLLNDEVFVRQITAEGTAEGVNTYNEPTIPEDIIRGDLELVKFGEPTDDEEDQMTPLSGIIFEITSKTTGKTVEITTDKRGFASTKQLGISERGSLPFDTYIVREKNTPAGLDPVDDFEITISEEGQVLYYILEDKQIISPVKLVKVDSTTGKTIPIAETEFQLLDKDKNPISMETHYPGTVVHETFKTDKTGSFILPEKLPAGTYYFRELNAPEGYLLNGEDLKFEIIAGYDWDEPLIVTFEDAPAMGRIEIVKTDADDGEPLSGAEFTITAAEDIVTPDGTVRAAAGDVVDTVTTGEDGTIQTKDLFLGKYTVKETKQPAGYVLPEKSWDVELVYQDQETEIVLEHLDVENTPTKIVITKVQTGTDKTLGGVTFEVWNKEMVEDDVDPGASSKAVYVTDASGQIILERLIQGTYCIQEKEAIPGYAKNNTVYEFTVAEDGRIDGEDSYEITVGNDKTEVTETNVINTETENQLAYPTTVTAVDTVSMVNLQPYQTYTLKGALMERETGKPIKDKDGEPVITEQMFTATASQMDVDVTFRNIDLSEYAGRTAVVFEYLYQDGMKISSHADLFDQKQQLRVMNPKLHTTAIDLESGSHQAIAKDDITIRDQVDYKNIIPGEYILKGILMNQKTGEPLLVDGKQVTAEKKVHIKEKNGTISMDFKLDASELNKTSTVVFEYLYPVNPDKPDESEDKPVASHEDIRDKDQTVTFKVGSLFPFLPGQRAPQTGISDNIWYLLAVAVTAGAGILVGLKRKKSVLQKKEQEREEKQHEDKIR